MSQLFIHEKKMDKCIAKILDVVQFSISVEVFCTF